MTVKDTVVGGKMPNPEAKKPKPIEAGDAHKLRSTAWWSY